MPQGSGHIGLQICAADDVAVTCAVGMIDGSWAIAAVLADVMADAKVPSIIELCQKSYGTYFGEEHCFENHHFVFGAIDSWWHQHKQQPFPLRVGKVSSGSEWTGTPHAWGFPLSMPFSEPRGTRSVTGSTTHLSRSGRLLSVQDR